MQTTPIQKALDIIDALSDEDQSLLLDLVQRRLTDRHRVEIARHAEETLHSILSGNARVGSCDDLKKALIEEE